MSANEPARLRAEFDAAASWSYGPLGARLTSGSRGGPDHVSFSQTF
jgi:hypothetical protein